ncbi:diguanylate cyclase [bacterium]|nr:diguanylate cyclase [bacterium]
MSIEKGRRILVVEQDKDMVQQLTESLSKEGHNVTHADDADTTLHRVQAWKPHLILLNTKTPGLTNYDLIPKLRRTTQDDYVSVILLSEEVPFEEVLKGFEAGADDHLLKPIKTQELLSKVRIMLKMKELQDSLRRANHRIEELSTISEVTGLLNMKALYRKGEEEIVRCRRFKKPISALLVNLDKFSVVNESNDFIFGSRVLREVGARIKQCVRNIDMVGHVGADEFLILLLETDLAGAEFVAERIRDSIQSSEFRVEKHFAKITSCIGVAGLSRDRSDGKMADLLRNAGEALRSAKAAGTNRIEIYSFAS